MLIEAKGREAYSKLTQPWKKRGYNPSIDDIMHVTAEIAEKMPALAVPVMSSEAQDQFREILNYELPQGGPVYDHLTLAWARGFCVNPCDWVPSSEAGHGFPDLYQPWAIWLAEEGYTPLYSGVPLTAENFDAWTPTARRHAFKHLQFEDRQAAHDLLLNVVTKKPAAIRFDLLKALSANALFSGNFPSDVPVIQAFLNDPSSKVRALAQSKLDKMGHLLTKADHAKVVTRWFTLTNGRKNSGISTILRKLAPRPKDEPTGPKYVISPEALDQEFKRSFCSADLDSVADVLGLTPYEMIEDFDLDMFKGAIFRLFMSVQDTDAKRLLARRLAKAGKECPEKLFRELDKKTWEIGLQAILASDDIYQRNTLFNFLGRKAGTLGMDQIRKIKSYQYMKASITAEREEGKRPEYVGDDTLRLLALVASKDAASELLDEARSAGASEDNPRLAPLTFNLQL